MYITIKSLWERHKNKSMIARLTGRDWKTVAKRIKEIEEGKEYIAQKPHPRMLDYHKEQIMESHWLFKINSFIFRRLRASGLLQLIPLFLKREAITWFTLEGTPQARHFKS